MAEPIRVALAQLAPRLGRSTRTSTRHARGWPRHVAQGADLVVFPELGLTGYLLQDLNADVAMRADDPRLRRLAGAAEGMSVRGLASWRSRTTTGSSSRRRCWRAARCATSTARCSCPTTACSMSGASSRPVRCMRATRRRPRPPARHLRVRGLLAPGHAAAAGARRRPGDHQRLVVAGPRHRRGQRERPWHGRPRGGRSTATTRS